MAFRVFLLRKEKHWASGCARLPGVSFVSVHLGLRRVEGVEGFGFEASRAFGSRFVGEFEHLSFSRLGLAGFRL